MDTNEHEFRRRQKTLLTPGEEILHKAEVFSIVGAAMAVRPAGAFYSAIRVHSWLESVSVMLRGT
jgi:hypothetical protein